MYQFEILYFSFDAVLKSQNILSSFFFTNVSFQCVFNTLNVADTTVINVHKFYE